MKTISQNTFSSTINPLCESSLRSLFSRSLFWVRGLFTLVRSLRLSQTFARAGKDLAAGLSVLLLSMEAQINRRVFVGLVWMGVVAPLSACVYMLFDWRVDKVAGWYHDNYFHFFLLLAPYFFVLACLIGMWFLFPDGSKRAYALIVPSGYTVGKILWLALVNNDTEFYSLVPLSFIMMGALISGFFFIALDWLAHRKFHRQDAFEARMDKLCELADDFDDAKFKSMIKNVHREKKAFQKSY